MRRPVLDADARPRGEHPGRARRRCSPGAPKLRERLGDLEFRISPDAFFQTNTEMAERLYGTAVELAALRGHERVFDLFSGIGTIALSLAARAREVVGRGDRRGRRWPTRSRTRAATRSRTRASSPATSGSPCASWWSGPGGPTCASSTRRAPASRRRSCAGSPRRARKRIVYVSCNPTTLAPNAAQLTEAGWTLTPRAPRRHVPADAAHRVRRAARTRLNPPEATGPLRGRFGGSPPAEALRRTDFDPGAGR